MRKLRYLKLARQDVLRQESWYIEQLAYDAALKFVDAVYKTSVQLLNAPGIGRLEIGSSKGGLQSVGVEGFEAIRIFYKVGAEGGRRCPSAAYLA